MMADPKDLRNADQAERAGKSGTRPDEDNNLGRGAPFDREERIRQRAHQIWEQEGQPEGHAQDHWDRAAQDLDKEESNLQREGAAGDKPGARQSKQKASSSDKR